MQPFEIIETHDWDVACDGGKGALGHPRVYLHIDHLHGNDTIQCPYCSRLYVLKGSSQESAVCSK